MGIIIIKGMVMVAFEEIIMMVIVEIVVIMVTKDIMVAKEIIPGTKFILSLPSKAIESIKKIAKQGE